MSGFFGLLLACIAVLLLSGEISAGQCLILSSRGTKQGPLLMLDQWQAFCDQYIRTGRELTAPGNVAEVSDLLATVRPPAKSVDVSIPPVADDALVFTAPFECGCLTTSGGTGAHSVASSEARGEFSTDLLVAGGRYGYSVASPCMRFTAPVTGTAHCRMAIVMNGVAKVFSGPHDRVYARVSAWIAHCHPREEGQYYERIVWQNHDMAGLTSFQDAILTQEADLPVREGGEYRFGAGLGALGVAEDHGVVGMKIWGSLAWLTIEFTAAE